ncbi:hypothetical protein [Streptomyces sp. MJP52]|uniref:hypothetical protein n=1 Tax=Streptomyces sp. MJP52 TaxID=2940555 RepID=UPI0024760CD2|nr:hypothetical protein [Streptomyces sp. MJP52]MDH6227853.1 hypothetical protein [Streptomyces sp. MJP52]
MAVVFELVVNFGSDPGAAREAARGPLTSTVLRAGARHVACHPPLLNTRGPYAELSLIPVAVGYGVSLDRDLPRLRLSAAELSELGHGLYAVLRRLDGYVAAAVGWDPEWQLDTAGLAAEWSEELADGSLDGHVVRESLRDELGLGDSYVPFRPGYLWVPYRGETRPNFGG